MEAVALGSPAATGEKTGVNEPTCTIRPVERTGVYVTIQVKLGGKRAYEAKKQNMAGSFTVVPITGLGDDAFTVGKELTVVKGDVVAIFFIGGVSDDSGVGARVEALARAGTARL